MYGMQLHTHIIIIIVNDFAHFLGRRMCLKSVKLQNIYSAWNKYLVMKGRKVTNNWCGVYGVVVVCVILVCLFFCMV